MNIISRKSRLFAVLATIAMATLTSCNRGVGCPTNFSLNEFIGECVSVAISIL